MRKNNADQVHLKTWYGMLATFFAVGNFSKMPGTLGTLVAAVILMIAGDIGIVPILLVVVVGTIASEKYVRATGRDDPGEIVIDEVAGYWVAVYGLGAPYGIVGFFLFRIIDILKPFPVRQMERLPGGVGVMADDICGGVMANLLMRLLSWLFLADGLTVVYEYLGIGG